VGFFDKQTKEQEHLEPEPVKVVVRRRRRHDAKEVTRGQQLDGGSLGGDGGRSSSRGQRPFQERSGKHLGRFQK